MSAALNTMFIKKAILGDHNVCFYDSYEEKQSILFSNLKAGLDQGCAALYVENEENIERLKGETGKFGLKIDAQKKIRIMSTRHFYAPDGKFHVNRAIEQIRSNVDESLDSGFKGLYVSADVSKFFELMTKDGTVEEWFEYERTIGKTVQFPVEVMCAYNINQVKANNQLFFQIIQSHKNTVNAKELEFVDNGKICIQVITETLEKILGKESAEFIFCFLEKRSKLPRNKILPQIVEFNKYLELLLGDGAITIEKNVLKKLHKKTGIINTRVHSG